MTVELPTYQIYERETRTREEWLSKIASNAYLGQVETMGDCHRGWAGRMVEIDNIVRIVAGLREYDEVESPVVAYIKLVNGDDNRFDKLAKEIKSCLGEDLSGEFIATTLGRAASLAIGGLRYAPPPEFTYATLLLDDQDSQ